MAPFASPDMIEYIIPKDIQSFVKYTYRTTSEYLFKHSVRRLLQIYFPEHSPICQGVKRERFGRV